jgi:Tfp pilus assembly protein PilX
MWVCSVRTQSKYPRRGALVSLNDPRGMAMLTVMMVLLMLTVLGIAAITASGLGNNMAGLQRTMEASANAAESCLGTGVNIIQHVLLAENGRQIPSALLSSTTGGPVPSGNKAVLESEISGNSQNNTDVPIGSGSIVPAPNLQMTVGPYAVAGDIDFLYVKQRAGSGQMQFSGYEGAGAGGGNDVDAFYRLTCVATNVATGTESQVSAIYACSLGGDGCQKQP